MLDDERFSCRGIDIQERIFGPNILLMEGPEHRHYRRIVQAAFGPRELAVLREYLETEINGLLDEEARGESCDLLRLLETYTVRAIGHVCEIEDFERYRDDAVALAHFHEDAERSIQASGALAAAILPAIDRVRERPTNGVLSRIVHGEADGAKLTDLEIVSFLRALLPAGTDTTSRWVAITLLCLLQDPEAMAAVRADCQLIRSALEETLRWEPAASIVNRQAMLDVEIGGTTVPAGDLVWLSIGSANRDPSVFVDPDRWDLHRNATDHLAFSMGTHFCLGFHLAWLEADVAMRAILSRFPQMKLDPISNTEIRGLVFRKPESLQIRPG